MIKYISIFLVGVTFLVQAEAKMAGSGVRVADVTAYYSRMQSDSPKPGAGLWVRCWKSVPRQNVGVGGFGWLG